jgi:hypothetical protein
VEVTKTGQDADLTGDMACSIHVIVNS